MCTWHPDLCFVIIMNLYLVYFKVISHRIWMFINIIQDRVLTSISLLSRVMCLNVVFDIEGRWYGMRYSSLLLIHVRLKWCLWNRLKRVYMTLRSASHKIIYIAMNDPYLRRRQNNCCYSFVYLYWWQWYISITTVKSVNMLKHSMFSPMIINVQHIWGP